MDQPVARKGLFLGYHLHPGGKWNGDYQVADLDQFLDNPAFEMKTARMHRTSRVDFDKNNILFPIRTAVDLAEQRAERCKNLHEVIDGNVVQQAVAEGGSPEKWGLPPILRTTNHRKHLPSQHSPSPNTPKTLEGRVRY